MHRSVVQQIVDALTDIVHEQNLLCARAHLLRAVELLEDELVELGYRTCDTCDHMTEAGDNPDWTNGQCENCDPEGVTWHGEIY